jgi:hypothetical protein
VDDLGAELIGERARGKSQTNDRGGGPCHQKEPHEAKLDPIPGSRKRGHTLP